MQLLSRAGYTAEVKRRFAEGLAFSTSDDPRLSAVVPAIRRCGGWWHPGSGKWLLPDAASRAKCEEARDALPPWIPFAHPGAWDAQADLRHLGCVWDAPLQSWKAPHATARAAALAACRRPGDSA